MNRRIQQGIGDFIRDLLEIMHRRRTVLISLSCVVVFVTTYLLILPAFTLDKDEAEEQGGIDVPAAELTEDTDTDQKEEVKEEPASDPKPAESDAKQEDQDKETAEESSDETAEDAEAVPEEKPAAAGKLTAEYKKYSVTVSYDSDAGIPENA